MCIVLIAFSGVVLLPATEITGILIAIELACGIQENSGCITNHLTGQWQRWWRRMKGHELD